MKKILIAMSALVVASSVFAANNSAPANTTAPATINSMRIGIVDVRQVLQTSPQVAAAQKKMQAEFADRQKQLAAAQQQLQQDTDKLNKDGAVMKAADRDALVKKAQTEQQNLRNMQMSMQKDLYAEQNAAMQKILDQMKTIIAQIAKAQNLNLVITKDAVAYGSDDVDITSQVAAQMK